MSKYELIVLDEDYESGKRWERVELSVDSRAEAIEAARTAAANDHECYGGEFLVVEILEVVDENAPEFIADRKAAQQRSHERWVATSEESQRQQYEILRKKFEGR